MPYAAWAAAVFFAVCSSAQAAPVAPPCTDASARCLEAVGQLYMEALLSHDGSRLPLAPDVVRTENALVNARGAEEVRESFVRTKMVKAHRSVRMYADEKRGEVMIFYTTDLELDQVNASGTTRAGNSDYKVANVVPPGSYTSHGVKRFKIARGIITQIEIINHIDPGSGKAPGWPAK